MSPQLSEFSIYTIAHRDKLAAAATRNGMSSFTENSRWTTGERLWKAARAAGVDMPVVLGDAADCSSLLYWGVLRDIALQDRKTTYAVEAIRPIRKGHSPQELVLRSTGEWIAPGFIRPYAIVQTPSFLR